MRYFTYVLLSSIVALAHCQSFLDYLNYVAAKELEYDNEYRMLQLRSHRSTYKRPGVSQQQKADTCSKSTEAYSDDSNVVVDIRFPKARVQNDDEYLCTAHPVPFNGETSYVVGFTPQASMNASHHMLVFGCSTPYSQKPYWRCGMGQVCNGQQNTIWAWARNAPPLKMPHDIGYRIGNEARTNFIVVQMHYSRRLPPGSYDCSGVTVKATLKPQRYLAGIFLLGAPFINIPPHSNSTADVSCHNYVPSTLHVFAFRTHAHSLGTVISGYRVRNGNYKMIGKGNPKWPHAFYTRVGGTIDLENGDTLLARCNYDSNRDTVTIAGMGGNDEMCNFYMMFYTESSDVANAALSCWGNNLQTRFPNGADDLAPFPGFAGEDSMVAISSGRVPIPSVPEMHSHHHHMNSAEENTQSEPSNNSPQDDSQIHTVCNMKWSSQASLSTLGQVGGVAVDSGGFVHVFHRAYRRWDATSFDYKNRFTLPNKPITANTVYVYDPADGTLIHQWGNNTFFMPHGASFDHHDNIWLTDVAMHQVFKYQYGGSREASLTLGTKMIPGNDKSHFCKPTDVAVEKDGTIYVSDGYCNGRVVKFNANGKYITSWGRMSNKVIDPTPGTFSVAHSIKLVKNEQHVCVADRENGRVQCFTKQGELIKIIQDLTVIGNAIYAIAYDEDDDVMFAVNGPPSNGIRTAGFTIDYETNQVLDIWEPSKSTGLSSPHDIAISPFADELYVGQLSPHWVYQFKLTSPTRQSASQRVAAKKHDNENAINNMPHESQGRENLEEIKRPADNANANMPESVGREMIPGQIKDQSNFAAAENPTTAENELPSSAPITSDNDVIEADVAAVAAGESESAMITSPDERFVLKTKSEGISRTVTTALVVVLLLIPVILFFLGICYVRSRTRRLKKYQDFLADEKMDVTQNKSFMPVTGKLNLGKFFNKSNPEQQGFERVKTIEDDEDVATDEEPEISTNDYVAKEAHDERQAE